MSKNELLLNRLKDLKQEVEGIINHLSDEDFTCPPPDGGWTVSQVINHIIISETGTTRYVNKKLQGLNTLPKAGMKNQLSSRALKVALKSPKKWKAPPVLPDPENLNKAETLEKWNSIREELYSTFESLPMEAMDREIFKHPVAGYFTPEQTLHFLTDHIRHHLPQIKRTIANIR